MKKDVENLNNKNTLEQSSGDNLQAVKNTACDFVVVKPTRKITKKHKKSKENTAKKALKNAENAQKNAEKTLKNSDFDAKNASKNGIFDTKNTEKTLKNSDFDSKNASKNGIFDTKNTEKTLQNSDLDSKNASKSDNFGSKNTEKTLKNSDFDSKNTLKNSDFDIKNTEKTQKNSDFDAKNASKSDNFGSKNTEKTPKNNGEARSEIANINKKGIIPDLITAEDIADDKAVAEAKIAAQKEAIRRQKLVTANYIWTLICTVYVIVSTVVLISKGWIESIAAYVLIGLLVVYILAFAVIVSIDHQNRQKGAKRLSYYKKLLAIFKIFANMMFLAVSAVTLVGVAGNGKNIVEWIIFVLTFVTVSIQLALKISLLVVRLKRKHIGKRYKVQIYSYVNGKEQKKKTSQKISESMYKNDN